MRPLKDARPELVPMTIDPNEATTSLQDIATVERRTREAMFYGGSSAIFIMWGVLVACGYGLTELYPRPGIIWLGVSAAGCAATALIIALRMHARPSESRDWRVIWAMLALSIFGAAWSFLLGIALIVIGYLQAEPWLRLWMAAVQSGTLIVGGVWLGRKGVS